MSKIEEGLGPVHLRELAAKCRRLAGDMNDTVTVKALRQMAVEYDRLAHGKEQQFPQPSANVREV